MWNPANRGGKADIEKTTKRYPTDLTDEEWERTRPFLPTPTNGADVGAEGGVASRKGAALRA